MNVVIQNLDTVTSRQAGLVIEAGELDLVVTQGAEQVGLVADVVARLVAGRIAFGVEVAAVLGAQRRQPQAVAPAVGLALEPEPEIEGVGEIGRASWRGRGEW